mmetsp:Transcript_18101/g.50458  ORF Transcript_18101/g.50458 Transcript_18101/m.50458 type:complete len:399 (+) Transcript_18101:2-1198(+)
MPSGAAALVAAAGGAVGSSSAPALGSAAASLPQSPSAGSTARVESVTVVAVQQPEEGGLLLRVLPNVVSRPLREASASRPSDPGGVGGGDASPAAEAEDWEVPPEPACHAFVSRLEAHPLKREGSEGDDTVCVICAEDMVESDALVVSFHCGHSFHDSCIRQWFTRRHTCPTCRFGFEVDDVRYLRSIGLTDEAEVLDKAQKEKQAVENAKQVAARRRWVESMRRGDPVHFGLSCGRCGISPLIGDCYRCCTCDGFVLCSDCHVEHQALRRAGGPSSGAVAGASGGEEHPLGHVFAPFGAGVLAGGAGERGVPPGRGGLLTVLVPAPAYGGQSFEDGAAEDDDYEEAPVAGEASVAAAEVAFAAVRSLALAPLAGSPIGSVVGGLSPRTLRRRAQRGR